MKLALLAGSTDVSVYVFIQDTTAYAVGGGLTSLVFNSSGLTCYYVRPLGNATQINLATQTVTGAHSDGGFVEVDATNMPGIYRLDLPDAVCAASAQQAVIVLKGAANMAQVNIEIQLSDMPVDESAITTDIDSNSTQLAAIVEDTGITLPAQISGLNDLSAAEVNAEVVDALATDTYAEPASVPAATASLKDKINWLFVLARNKIPSTSTTATLRNDADDATIATASQSDDGTTFTRGKWS